jgi:hypothetical protein
MDQNVATAVQSLGFCASFACREKARIFGKEVHRPSASGIDLWSNFKVLDGCWHYNSEELL